MNQAEGTSQPITAEGARAAVLAGLTVRFTVGAGPGDPVSLLYIDRCAEFDGEPQIYTESVEGWSHGVKEAVCEPDSEFFVEFISDALSLEVTEQEPPQRETPKGAAYDAGDDPEDWDLERLREEYSNLWQRNARSAHEAEKHHRRRGYYVSSIAPLLRNAEVSDDRSHIKIPYAVWDAFACDIAAISYGRAPARRTGSRG